MPERTWLGLDGLRMPAQLGPGADDYGHVLFGRPPTDLGRGLPPQRALSSAFKAAAGPAQKVHDKARQVKHTVQQDDTKLPFAVTHPTSVDAHHVASSSTKLLSATEDADMAQTIVTY